MYPNIHNLQFTRTNPRFSLNYTGTTLLSRKTSYSLNKNPCVLADVNYITDSWGKGGLSNRIMRSGKNRRPVIRENICHDHANTGKRPCTPCEFATKIKPMPHCCSCACGYYEMMKFLDGGCGKDKFKGKGACKGGKGRRKEVSDKECGCPPYPPQQGGGGAWGWQGPPVAVSIGTGMRNYANYECPDQVEEYGLEPMVLSQYFSLVSQSNTKTHESNSTFTSKKEDSMLNSLGTGTEGSSKDIKSSGQSLTQSESQQLLSITSSRSPEVVTPKGSLGSSSMSTQVEKSPQDSNSSMKQESLQDSKDSSIKQEKSPGSEQSFVSMKQDKSLGFSLTKESTESSLTTKSNSESEPSQKQDIKSNLQSAKKSLLQKAKTGELQSILPPEDIEEEDSFKSKVAKRRSLAPMVKPSITTTKATDPESDPSEKDDDEDEDGEDDFQEYYEDDEEEKDEL